MDTQETMENGWIPAAYAGDYNSNRFDFVWNDDFTAFKPLRLSWWDDASYIRYQGCLDFDEEITEEDLRKATEWSAANPVKAPASNDEIPF